MIARTGDIASGGDESRRQGADPLEQRVECGVECGGRADAGGVSDRPVQVVADAQSFVRIVADRDDQVAVAADVVHVTGRSTRIHGQPVSGGGRIASQSVTHFPQLFTGAIFMVGADYFMPEDASQRTLLASRRLVFVTGSRDFNHREMRRVHDRYGCRDDRWLWQHGDQSV